MTALAVAAAMNTPPLVSHRQPGGPPVISTGKRHKQKAKRKLAHLQRRQDRVDRQKHSRVVLKKALIKKTNGKPSPRPNRHKGSLPVERGNDAE